MGSRFAVAAGVCLGLFAAVAGAKPVITVDKKVFVADTVVEGTREAVTCVFRIKNTGDEVLQIKSVRPG